jgi:hypothetical protein
MSINSQPQKNLFGDLSLWFLLFSNFAMIFIATKENWNLSTIMWVYWFQSITIGLFNFIRILQLKEFSTQGVEINGQPAQSAPGANIFIAFFFLIHYGTFHFVYFMFLLTGTFAKTYGNGPNLIELKYIFLTAFLFFLSHLFSFFYNRPRVAKKQDIGSLMFYPYARIIPMHLTIIFGNALGGALVFFLVLKTIADGIMHFVEHNIFQSGESQET